MKKILVPTDFSENAANAFKYAIALAKKIDSDLFLMHTFKVPSHSGVLLSMEKEFLETNEKAMDTWLEECGRSIPKKIRMYKKVIMGYLNAVVPGICRREGIELIIMGTKGATGLKEVFLGSNTVAMIKKTNVAVLAIPEGYQFVIPKTVVLAVDELVIEREEALAPLLEILKVFKSKLKIVHVKRQGVANSNAKFKKNFANLFNDFEYEFLHLESDDISEEIQHYTTSVKAEMLCMISRKRNWLFDRMFKSSVAYKTAFHTNLPFLVLSDE